MKQAQPLLALSSKHTRSHYQWECLERIDTKFHSSPVIYVNTPGLFRCTVGNSEQTVQSNVFDVQMIVNWDDEIGSVHSEGQFSQSSVVEKRSDTVQQSYIIRELKGSPVLEISKQEILDVTKHLNEQLIIGQGAFGTVYRVDNFRCPGTSVAIKVLNKDGCDAVLRAHKIVQLDNEVKALTKLVY